MLVVQRAVELIERYHARFGEAILVDCHSMPHEAIEAVGSPDAVQAAITLIKVSNLSVEVLGYVPANLRAVG